MKPKSEKMLGLLVHYLALHAVVPEIPWHAESVIVDSVAAGRKDGGLNHDESESRIGE